MSAPDAYLSALYDIIDFHSERKIADRDGIWGRVAERLCQALGARAGTYYAYLPEKRQLMPRMVLGMAAPDISDTAVDIRTGICGWVATHRQATVVQDAYKDPRFLREVDEITGFRTRSVLAVPLHDRLELTGILEILNKRAGPFTAEDLRFVETACRLTTVCLRAPKKG